MARLVFAVAAGAVAYVASGGNPVVALQVGTLAYGFSGFLDPNKKVQGPRLSDLKAPQATYGSPVAYIEGSPRGAWNVAWASDKREIANTQTQGKGGPGVDSTTFTYEMDVLYLVDINGAAALRRVWSNGKLIWSNADDADGETLVASSLTASWRDIRFYSGALDQLPDPTYEAAVGVGNAPAYRGRCTIMVEGLNLGGSGQMPVLTFEVLTEADSDYAAANFATFPLEDALDTDPSLSGISAMNPAGFDFLYGVDFDDFNGGHLGYKVFHVDLFGTITETASFTYGGGVGSGTGKEGNALQGSSDESVLVVYEFDPAFTPAIDHVTMYRTDGSSVAFSFGIPDTDDLWVFAKRGSAVVLVSVGVGSSAVMRIHNANTGALVIETAAMPTIMQFAAIGDGVVYGLESDGSQTGNNVYQVDLATGALIQTIPTPIAAVQAAIACDTAGTLYLFAPGVFGNQNPVYKWDGAVWTKILNEPLLYASPSDRHAYYAADGILALQRYDDSGLEPFREQFYIALAKVAVVDPTLDQVVRRLCLRTGQLTDADIDVTDLEGDVVHAMAITQAATTRAAIEILMSAYLFECVEGEKLRFVKRGGSSVASIPYEDLGASADGKAEPLPLKRLNDPEIAARVSVKFANILNDFQDGLVQADRLVSESTAEQVVEVPLGFTPTEAARLADANTMDLAVGLIQIGPIALPRKWCALEPTDVVTLTDANGDTFRARIIKGTIGGGILQFELVLDDATAINSVAETDSNYESSTLIRQAADTVLVSMDIAPLTDAFAGPGYIAAFGASGIWPGAELDRSLDDVTYAKVLDVADRAVMGTASTVLGDFSGGNVFDEITTLTVDVGSGELSSSTRDAMLTSNVNALAVGSNSVGWEVVQFRSASLLSPGVYLLSGFLRGRRGTEWMIGGHVANEHVVLLQVTGLRHVDDTQADVGVPYYLKAVTHGKSRAAAASQVFTDTGVAQKPFAPVDLRFDTASSVLTWHRRSRLASRFLGITDPPLGETIEAYSVEVSDGVSVVDTATVSVPSYSASGLTGGDYIEPPIWGMKVIGGTRVAIRQDSPLTVQSSPAFSEETILALNTDGTVAEHSATLENIVTQWDNNSTAVYVVGYRVSNTIPPVYTDSKVQKLTVGTLASVDATNTSSTAGDYYGVAHDGTDVWVSEHISDNLRRLNSTTLVSIASYAVTGGPGAIRYAGGKLYAICTNSGELVCFDTTSHTEDYRVSVVGSPFDVLVVGSVVFVAGASSIGVYDASDGSLITSHVFQVFYFLPMRQMAVFGSQVVIAGSDIAGGTGGGVLFLNATTGARENLLRKPVTDLAYVAGSVSADLYLTGSIGAGNSYRTRMYEVAPANLAGYSITVRQLSSAVGAGYPATIEL